MIRSFNDGDLMGDVRTRSLLPLIDLANSIDSEVKTVKTRSSKAFVSCHLDVDAKTLTFGLSDGGTVTCNLSDLFKGGGTPLPTHTVYYGFSPTDTVSPVEIKTGTKVDVTNIHGKDITLTRSTSTPAYIFFWKSDDLPDVKAFKFGGFNDVWKSVVVNVDRVKGTLYVSDNPTSATSISFEVIV